MATLGRPLVPAAVDGRPVDALILIVSPLAEPRLMLRTLAAVARMVKGGNILPALRRAETADEMRRIFNAVP